MSNSYERGVTNPASNDSSPELLNFESCQLRTQEGREASPCKSVFYLCLSFMEWTISTFRFIFFQDMHLSGIVKDCASAVFLVVVLSAV